MESENQEGRRSPVFLGERHTSLFSRAVAKTIDVVIVVAVYFLGSLWGPWVGLPIALGLCAAQDSFWVGQSIGKRIMGLRVIEDHFGQASGLKQSTLRNFPFLLAFLTLFTPPLKIVFILVALPVLGFELYLVYSLTSGVRLGDILGNTLVVEYFDSAGAILHGHER